PGESASGDDAAFVRGDARELLALADGLGHGPPAREASARVMVKARAASERGPDELLESCEAALVGTRGAVAAAAALDRGRGEIAYAGIGNVEAHLYRPRAAR